MAISAPKDANRVSVLMATLNTDGLTPILIKVNASDHSLNISNGTSGSSIVEKNAERDANRIPVLWATSSTDGITPISVYADSSGKLLTK